MILVIGSFFIAYWFDYEFSRFSNKINRQVYQDFLELYPLNIPFSYFSKHSKLQPKSISPNGLFKAMFPLIAISLFNQPLLIGIIALILVYLCWLDYAYYLTDIRYLILIFLLSLAYLLFYAFNPIELLFNLFITTLFFSLFSLFIHTFFKKTLLGSGDILLFIALSPLFSLDQMLLLELIASISGLVFTFGYFCKFRRKIDRLPFIPFITFASLLLFLLHFTQNI